MRLTGVCHGATPTFALRYSTILAGENASRNHRGLSMVEYGHKPECRMECHRVLHYRAHVYVYTKVVYKKAHMRT